MAKVLKFRRDTTDLDLNAGKAGVQVRQWSPVIATPLYGRNALPVTEKMRVKVTGSDQDDLASDLQAFAQMQVWADQYRRDRNTEHPVWLYSTLENETGARRSCIRSIVGNFITSWYGQFARANEARAALAVTRYPWWEAVAIVELPENDPGALGFDSGSTVPVVGEVLTGDTSGATAVVAKTIRQTGTWAGTDAAGTFLVSHHTGTWQNNEPINGATAGNDCATTDGVIRGAAALTYDYTSVADIVGDQPGRLADFDFAIGAGVAARFWMGLKSDRRGNTPQRFFPIWELTDGTNNASESGVTDDTATDVGNASPGGTLGRFVKLVETDLDWDKSTNGGIYQEVMSIKLGDITAQESEQYGEYLWLLRAKVTAGTWEVQLRFGNTGQIDGDYVQKRIVQLSNASWDYYAMATTGIPGGRTMRVYPTANLSDLFDQSYNVQIWARRTSGAGNLYLDCFSLIPVDEGYLFVDSNIDLDLDPIAQTMRWAESPAGEGQVMLTESGGFTYMDWPEYEFNNFRLPPGDGRMIIVHARTTGSVLTDMIEITDGEYHSEWSSMRGAG